MISLSRPTPGLAWISGLRAIARWGPASKFSRRVRMLSLKAHAHATCVSIYVTIALHSLNRLGLHQRRSDAREHWLGLSLSCSQTLGAVLAKLHTLAMYMHSSALLGERKIDRKLQLRVPLGQAQISHAASRIQRAFCSQQTCERSPVLHSPYIYPS